MAGPNPKGSGKVPGSGRKKGTPNKVNALLKDQILLALDELGKVHVVNGEACIACGQCELRCPDYAIFVDKKVAK